MYTLRCTNVVYANFRNCNYLSRATATETFFHELLMKQFDDQAVSPAENNTNELHTNCSFKKNPFLFQHIFQMESKKTK